MKTSARHNIIAAGLLLSASLAPALVWAQAEEFEPMNVERKASDILPAEVISGPHYTIDERVVTDGFTNHYTVQSDFGPFKARNDAMLRRLIREINAIAQLKEIETTEAFGDGVKTAVQKPLEGAERLIEDPVDTVSGIPDGISSLFSRAKMAITTEESEYEDGAAAAILQVSDYKRDLAKQMQIDVYSANPVLQEELNRIGWASAAGNLGPNVALLPVSGPVAMTISGLTWTDNFNDVIAETPPAQLKIDNIAALEGMGVADDLIDKFVNDKMLSPRNQTAITHAMAAMKAATGRQVLLEMAIQTETPVDAVFFQQIAETFAGYDETVSPIVELRLYNGISLGYAENGTVICALPLDYGRWTSTAATVLTDMVANYPKVNGAQRLEFWVTGQLSPLAKANIDKMGIGVMEDVDKKIGMLD